MTATPVYRNKLELTRAQAEKYPAIMNAPVEKLDYRGLMLRYQFQNAFDLYSGLPSAWCNFLIPSEIFHAMDIIPFVLENEAALLARTSQSRSFLESADALTGFRDICSYQRASLGAFLQEFLPKPTLIVNSTMPCDSVGKLCEVLGKHYQVPTFLLDIPYDRDEHSVRYLTAQIKKMVQFLADVTGRNLDPERLRHALSLSNESRADHVAANVLRQEREPLIAGNECLGLFATAIITLGSGIGRLVYRRFREQLEKTAVSRSAEERERLSRDKRIVWYHFKPFFDDRLIRRMEEELGARIVFEVVNDVYWEPYDLDRPYESLARKLLSMMLNGPLSFRLENFVSAMERFRADGVVNFLHFGCRHYNNGSVQFQLECRRRGIPYLGFDADCIDPSNYAEAQLTTRVEAFVESLYASA
ncbi:MAG: 2-hydroxyacyl-CoA dehydratase [Deltaproteobacteria bacterium]|nr:2-hydroxyacyl-CoA dehydratase [Deltaproteobacteria bacterium]